MARIIWGKYPNPINLLTYAREHGMFSDSDETEIERLCHKNDTEGLTKEEIDKLVELYGRYREEAKQQIAMARGF